MSKPQEGTHPKAEGGSFLPLPARPSPGVTGDDAPEEEARDPGSPARAGLRAACAPRTWSVRSSGGSAPRSQRGDRSTASLSARSLPSARRQALRWAGGLPGEGRELRGGTEVGSGVKFVQLGEGTLPPNPPRTAGLAEPGVPGSDRSRCSRPFSNHVFPGVGAEGGRERNSREESHESLPPARPHWAPSPQPGPAP